MFLFFVKHMTAYDMLIIDWSSEVFSFDLERGDVRQPAEAGARLAMEDDHRAQGRRGDGRQLPRGALRGSRVPAASDPGGDLRLHRRALRQIGRASCRERVCQYV